MVWLIGCAYAEPAPVEIRGELAGSDRALMARAFQESLDTHAIGETLNWSNADTGHRGTVTPFYAYQNDAGQDCLEYQQTITVEAETEITGPVAARASA